ncbi:hypothetical protein ACP275_13G193100 [Erythranthe tilingii]
MAALSYYSNWGPLQPVMDSDIISMLADPVATQPELPPELQTFPDVDYLLEQPNELFYPENPNSLLYDFTNGTLTEPFSVQQEIEPSFFNYPKRQKGGDYEEFYSDNNLFKPSSFFTIQNPSFPTVQDYSPPLPDFATGYTTGSCGEGLKKDISTAAGSTTLSAQSIAARQRRRKITEKTHELGKLVPGGQKMNTAEMLQSAYKYIKYLQAQVGILEYIDSYDHHHRENHEMESFGKHEELQVLLESPLIQEKLYSNEKCIVPQKFVDELSRSDDLIVKSNPELISLIVVKQEQ